MFKKSFLVFTAICVFSLTGCGAISSAINDFKGSIVGNTYTIDSFDNSGNLMTQMYGEKIDIEGNTTKTKSINSEGVSYNYELSSVLTITIDGYEMESCGDTLIFYEDGLEPDVSFDPNFTSETSSDGILDNTFLAGRINSVKNMFGKSRIVIIKSQLGNPIYAFSGDEVYWEIPDDLPKFTKLMVKIGSKDDDWKALYIHRANFQIIDKELLN